MEECREIGEAGVNGPEATGKRTLTTSFQLPYNPWKATCPRATPFCFSHNSLLWAAVSRDGSSLLLCIGWLSMLVAGDGQTPILFDTEAAWISPLISQVPLSIQQDTSGILLGSCLLRGEHKLLPNFSKARPSRPVAALPLNSSVQSKARSTSASKKRRNRPRRQNKTKIDLCLP